MSGHRPALRLVAGNLPYQRPVEWAWFCGHCAAPSPSGDAPAPNARVCPACGLGLLLETPREVAPSPREAFLVVDSGLRVHAVSRIAERLLGVREDTVLHWALHDLLVNADAELEAGTGLSAAIAGAAGEDDGPRRVNVRPANTFGVRLRARVAPCGPPRAALLVLDAAPGA